MVIGNFINWIVWPPQSHFACASWSRGGGAGIARFSFHIFNAVQRKSNHILFTKAVTALGGTMRDVTLLLLLFLGCTICLNFKKVNYCCNKSFQRSRVILQVIEKITTDLRFKVIVRSYNWDNFKKEVATISLLHCRFIISLITTL